MCALRFWVYVLIYAAIAYVTVAAFRLPIPVLHVIAAGLLVGATVLRVVTYIAEGLSIRPGRCAITGDWLCLLVLILLLAVSSAVGFAYYSVGLGFLFWIIVAGTWVIQSAFDPIHIIEGDLERISFKLIKILTVVGWVVMFASYITFVAWMRAEPLHPPDISLVVFAPIFLFWPALALLGQIFWGMASAATASRPYKFTQYDSGPVFVAAAPILGALLIIAVGSNALTMIGMLTTEFVAVVGIYWALYLLAKPARLTAAYPRVDTVAIGIHRDHDPHFLDRIP